MTQLSFELLPPLPPSIYDGAIKELKDESKCVIACRKLTTKGMTQILKDELHVR